MTRPVCNVRFNALEKRVDDMESLKDAVVRQTTLMEILASENAKRDELNRKQTDTLNKVSENLIVLTTEVKDMKKNISKLENKVDDNEKDNSISISTLLKKIITYIAVSGVGGLIIYFLTNGIK